MIILPSGAWIMIDIILDKTGVAQRAIQRKTQTQLIRARVATSNAK
jgi:hypothetical protein